MTNDRRPPPKQVKLVWVPGGEYKQFMIDHPYPTARCVAWPYSIHDEFKFGFYVEIDSL
jgi:hypothetical protein